MVEVWPASWAVTTTPSTIETTISRADLLCLSVFALNITISIRNSPRTHFRAGGGTPPPFSLPARLGASCHQMPSSSLPFLCLPLCPMWCKENAARALQPGTLCVLMIAFRFSFFALFTPRC